MGRRRKLTAAQRAMKQAAREWRHLPKSKRKKYKGFKDYAKVYIESHVSSKDEKKRRRGKRRG